MAEQPTRIELPKDVFDALLRAAGADDELDTETTIADFEANFRNETDVELERKRAIMRNRLLVGHGDKALNQQKLDVLTNIIQGNVRRRKDFEDQRAAGVWIRFWLGPIPGLIVGLLIGFFMNLS